MGWLCRGCSGAFRVPPPASPLRNRVALVNSLLIPSGLDGVRFLDKSTLAQRCYKMQSGAKAGSAFCEVWVLAAVVVVVVLHMVGQGALSAGLRSIRLVVHVAFGQVYGPLGLMASRDAIKRSTVAIRKSVFVGNPQCHSFSNRIDEVGVSSYPPHLCTMVSCSNQPGMQPQCEVSGSEPEHFSCASICHCQAVFLYALHTPLNFSCGCSVCVCTTG
jgi:hypothetical protein